jgi:bifunctional ADP-heptose synthase (sugar kinase/adenylyltransferase)
MKKPCWVGAGNLVRNLHTLGARVTVVGVIGHDATSELRSPGLLAGELLTSQRRCSGRRRQTTAEAADDGGAAANCPRRL